MDGQELNNLGAGQSGLVLVEQHGPAGPSDDVLFIAALALKGKGPLPHPCLDCAPNIVLVDSFIKETGTWEWGAAVAHDDTCPALAGKTALPTRNND